MKRAERINKLDGWDCVVTGNEKEMKATLTIFRKDWTHPFKHEAYFSECVQTKKDGSINKFWKKMPRFMLKKVCIAQGFRLCFPDEFGGMPYTNDELPEEMTTIQNHAKDENDTTDILKDVSQKIGKEKPAAVGFSEKADSERMKNELLEAGRPYQKEMNEEEVNFFKGIKTAQNYTTEQYKADKSKVFEIIDKYEDIGVIINSEPSLTDDSDVIPEFLSEDEQKQDELPNGVL